MKKFTFLCALLFSFCGIMTAQQVTSVDQLSNSKVYTMSSSRGYWMSGDTQLANGGTSISEDNPTAYQFGFYQAADGNYYLYSVTAGKFVVADGDGEGVFKYSIESPMTFVTDGVTEGCFLIQLGDYTMNFGGSKEVAINSWNTADDGNILTIMEAGDIEESVMQAAYDAVSGFGAAVEALENAISALEGIEIGDGLNQYSVEGATAEEVSAAIESAKTLYESISDDTSIESVTAATTELTEIAAALSLNMPKVGSLLRIRATASSQAAQPYLTGYNSSIEKTGSRAAFVTSKEGENEAATIFYYQAVNDSTNMLLSYGSGQYLTNSSNFAGYDGTTGTAVSFAACGNGEVNAYNVIYEGNSGATRYLYTNASDSLYFSDAGNGNSAAGYNFVLEEVESLPLTVGEGGYATLYAPAALTVPTGATAYTAAVDADTITLTSLSGAVPAATPVVVEAAAGTYNFAVTTSDATAESALTGTYPAIAAADVENLYTLQTVEGETAFYASSEETVAPFSAYLAAATDTISKYSLATVAATPASLWISSFTFGSNPYQGDNLSVSCTVTNSGGTAYEDYIYFYVYVYPTTYVTYGYAYASVAPGETKTVEGVINTSECTAGSYHYIYGYSNEGKVISNNSSYFYVYAPAKSELEEATESLEAAIAALDGVEIGAGYNQYSVEGTTAEEITAAVEAAKALYESISDTTSVESVTAATTQLTEIAAGLSLNMPEAGALLRIRATANSQAAQPYLTGYNSSISGKTGSRAAFVTSKEGDNEAATIFYLQAVNDSTNMLLSYGSGQYLTNSSNFAGYDGTTGTAISFSTTYNESNAYNVIFEGNSGASRNLYTNASDSLYFSDAGNGNTAYGYNFVLEEVDTLPLTVGEAGYATLYAPVALAIPEGVKAYTAAVDGETLALTELTEVIPAATPVVVEAAAGTYRLAVTASDATAESALTGTYPAIAAADVEALYTLQTVEGETAFYASSEETVAQFSAYLVAPDTLVTKYALAVAEVVEDYAISVDKTTATTRTDRYTTAISLTGSADGDQTLAVDQDSTLLLYNDLTPAAFTAKAGETVTAAISFSGQWMNGAVYIDRDQDGQFSYDLTEAYTPAEGSDIMTFSYYELVADESGVNSLGEAVTGDDRNVLDMPSFVIPEDLANGFYRIRYKVDWGSIDPAGNSDENNLILNNGGSIVDALINIHSDNVTISAASAENGAVQTAEGEALTSVTAPFGQAYTVTFAPAEGYALSQVVIRHGHNLGGEQMIHGNQQYAEVTIDAADLTDNTYAIPAEYVDGDIILTPVFVADGGSEEAPNIYVTDITINATEVTTTLPVTITVTNSGGTFNDYIIFYFYDTNSSYGGMTYTYAYIEAGETVTMDVDLTISLSAGKYYMAAYYNSAWVSASKGWFTVTSTDGIDGLTIDGENAPSKVYDLQGRPVQNPTKGLYIVDGKKVFIK